MGVSGEGAALRSARKWLLAAAPVPRNTGPKWGASARVRARLALYAPAPAFGRRRSRPLADRCLRPPSTVDRGLRPPLQIAGSRSMLQLLIHESMNELEKCDLRSLAWRNTPNFGPYVADSTVTQTIVFVSNVFNIAKITPLVLHPIFSTTDCACPFYLTTAPPCRYARFASLRSLLDRPRAKVAKGR